MSADDSDPSRSSTSLYSDWGLDRSSTYETTSGSSSSTVPGPGALSGKAIKALGRVTIRGIDHFVIIRQLSSIAHHFPLTDEKAALVKNAEELYSDALEFSRQGLYREEVNKKALRLLLGQIGIGETQYLVKALARWDKLELRLFLSETLSQLSPLWNSGLGKVLSSPLLSAYSRRGNNRLSISPFLLFVSKLVRTHSSICHAILDVGFLDVLTLIRSLNGLNKEGIVSENHSTAPNSSCRRLLAESNAILLDIVAYPEHRLTVLGHPICATWVTLQVPSTELAPFASRERALFLNGEQNIPDDDSSLYLTLDLPAIAKLGCVSELETAELVNSLAFGVEYDQPLRVFLLRGPYNQKVALLSRVFKYIHENSSSPSLPAHPDTLRSRYRLLFVLKLISAAAWGPSNRAALLDAGVVGFLVRVVQTEVPGSYSGIADAQIQTRQETETHPSRQRDGGGGRRRARTEARHPHADEDAAHAIPAIVCEAGLARLLGGPLARTSRLVGLIAAAFAALFPDTHGTDLSRVTWHSELDSTSRASSY
ncbi:hypothetical protein GGX14DRAFT_393433 [Mycena pura]|uniref:Uncharacterized protein n=1 Tax=Mycena pura TaxID=153505 RepID=A0AAD6VGV6_9AGAR|nr:hypothetical protein GGX14DRAFT_393433 [Mycena pura]